ncbi:MAG: HAMP domain-containing histidine kinase [Lachnospiraceae bacterium]|nr:HAMP domain-containing histidine kinase [Lachnospiraceae bacterium]
MKQKTTSIFSLKRYVIIFLFIGFVVTCSFYLFLSSFDFTGEQIRDNAIFTFLNILFLSLIFCVFDGIQRKITIERPVKKILKMTDELARGNFFAGEDKVSTFPGRNEFDIIAENINKMAEELSGIETLRTDFVSNVSHELKTPLAVIGNYSTMLQAQELPKEKRMEYAVAISEATGRLSELITNILKLNKLENQQIYPEKQTYNLSEQLAECILGFEDVWEKKNIILDTDMDDELTVTTNQELLSLVWNNLLSNAFKFTDEGGTVLVTAKRAGEKVQVSVSDTGCGISEDTGKHIFDKFYQGDTSHATKGNGLGLALVKRVIDICGAEISVSSTLGKGTTFTVTF